MQDSTLLQSSRLIDKKHLKKFITSFPYASGHSSNSICGTGVQQYNETPAQPLKVPALQAWDQASTPMR
jgi:hypothetical protein